MTNAWPLIGHEAAEARFLDAFERGQLHHAWLIEGPRGIGKMRLAQRLAAFLLGAKGAPNEASPDDPVVRALISRGHPDCKFLQRELNDAGKLRQDIAVDDVRALIHFFTLKPALGGWRVGIIDAMDDLNVSGANALLKTLEEPPPRSVLFLIHHATLPVLPTIRSRCRRLHLQPLNAEQTSKALELAGAPREAESLARGRPGEGIRLASENGLKAAYAARTLLRGWPQLKDNAIAACLQAALPDETSIAAFREEVMQWLADRAQSDSPDAPSAARIWLELSRLFGEAEDLNMDRAQLAAKAIAGLQSLQQAS